MQKIIDFLSQEYNLSNLKLLFRVDEGIIGENFALEANSKKFFLKLYHPNRSLKEVKKIHRVKQFFAQAGIPVILPISSIHKKTFSEFNNRRLALFPFVVGTKLPRRHLPPRAIKSLAEMTAKIHLAGQTPRARKINIAMGEKNWVRTGTIRLFSQIYDELEGIKKQNNFDRAAKFHLAEKIKFVKSNKLKPADFTISRNTLTHGDLMDHNVFFNSRLKVSHVFDWEKAVLTDRRLDLLRPAHYLLSGRSTSFEQHPPKFQLTDTFLSSYNSIFPISKAELSEAIDFFRLRWFHAAWILKEHYLNNNLRPDKFLPSQLQILGWFREDHWPDYKKRFLKVLK